MSTPDSNIGEKTARKYHKVSRESQVRIIQQLKEGRVTQTQVANEAGLSRTTLAHWIHRNRNMSNALDPNVVDFLESPSGLAHLHQVVLAAMYVFHKKASCGLPTLQEFFQQSGLDQFVASSIGSLSSLSNKIDGEIINFGEEERERLAANMPQKDITCCTDETFFPERMVLVMMEPCSNFILAEETESKRDTETWEAVGTAACKGLKVKIIQLASDEAKGLTSYALNVLGAHKSPDLFHVQQEIGKAVASHVGRKITQTQRAIEQAQKEHEDAYQRIKVLGAKPGIDLTNPPPSLLKAGKKLCRVDKQKEKDEKLLEKLKEHNDTVRQARKAIGTGYHPYNVETGESRTPDELKATLDKAYDELEQVADQVDCSDKQKKRLAKSRAMIPPMVATLLFFWEYTQKLIQGFQLSIPFEWILRQYLIPIAYLHSAYRRSKDKDFREKLLKTIGDLENSLENHKVWAQAPPSEQASLRAKAEQCANVFQRPSSCVEGRNGQISLRHHAHRGLSTKRLQILTIIHNFGVFARDGTTAARRFFEQQHRNLFEHLLDKVGCPLRPRRQKYSRIRRIREQAA